MKKYIIVMLLFFTVGCKNNYKDKLVCTLRNNKEENIVTIYFKNNESVNYDKVSKIIVDDDKDVSQYEVDDNYDNVKVVDNEVSLYVSEKIDNMTKEEVKSLYEHEGYICK